MIIVRIWEGLGNQLFQYAYARALREKGRDVRLDIEKTYENSFKQYRSNDLRYCGITNFNITVPQIDVEAYGKYSYLKRDNNINKAIYFLAKRGLWKYKIQEETTVRYNSKADNLETNYYVKGWFQDERYFCNIRNILLKELRPKKKILISKELREIIESEKSVSIHVRRGDYVKIGKSLPLYYYHKAIGMMYNKYLTPVFLLFSDDIIWAKKQFEGYQNIYFIPDFGKYEDYEELMIMSRCKSNIIANSTFSWWGAWLNNNPSKIVIAPNEENWMRSQKGIIPCDWIIV